MSLRLIATTALLSCLTLVAGCSVHQLVPPNLRPPENSTAALDKAKQQLAQATPCCTNFADFSFQDALPWQPKKFELGPGSMVASVNGDRSYFLSFSLPRETKLPYRVAIKSELNGRWLRSSYLFAPTVVVLDDAFQPLDSKDVGLCEHMGWTDESSGAFGSYEVTDQRARYLVLYSSSKQQSSDTYWEQSPATFSAEAPVQMAANGSFKVPHGPDGTVWVGLMNKTFQDAVTNAICSKPEQGKGVISTLRQAIPLPVIGEPADKPNAGTAPASPASGTENGSSSGTSSAKG